MCVGGWREADGGGAPEQHPQDQRGPLEPTVPSEHDFSKSGKGAGGRLCREGGRWAHQHPRSPPSSPGGRPVINTTHPPSSCPAPTPIPQGLAGPQNLGSARVQPGLPAALPLAKGKRARLRGFPAPSQLPKCSALLMKGPPLPLFSALCSNLSSPLITNSKHIQSRPGHQRTKACALPAECDTSLLGGFL